MPEKKKKKCDCDEVFKSNFWGSGRRSYSFDKIKPLKPPKEFLELLIFKTGEQHDRKEKNI